MEPWYELFRHSADAVFGVDRNRQIRFWNAACERLTGYRRDDVLGRRCAGVVCGSDLQDRPLCGSRCKVLEETRRHHGIDDFDMLVANSNGRRVLANVGAYYVPARLRRAEEAVMIFFALRDVDCKRLIQRMSTGSCDETVHNRRGVTLTKRERQVLQLAADGHRSRGIGAELGIAEATVRNHFKRVFRKLDVHSRAEAIYAATQRRLL
ncbi:MAG TPA: PAS domain-containing protein [Gammaproteobacteria bacterium]|nr:PAS domain-containing protein [Gammaproteobacteria bacterium]